MNVHLQECMPAQALKPYVACYREATFNTQALALLSQQVVPHGYLDLIIHLSDKHCELVYEEEWKRSSAFTLIGLWTQPYQVRFREQVDVFWIRFKPEGMHELFGITLTELENSQADIEEILGTPFRDFCDRMRDSKTAEQRKRIADWYLQKQLQKHAKTHYNYVLKAADLIRNEQCNLTIDQISDQVCISTRQLEREFKQKIGVSPKFYMRLARVNQAYRMLNENMPPKFTDVSYSCGYADQAHFIRDFKVMTGEAPKVFLKEKQQYIVYPD